MEPGQLLDGDRAGLDRTPKPVAVVRYDQLRIIHIHPEPVGIAELGPTIHNYGIRPDLSLSQVDDAGPVCLQQLFGHTDWIAPDNCWKPGQVKLEKE